MRRQVSTGLTTIGVVFLALSERAIAQDIGERLLADHSVQQAIAFAQRDEPTTVGDQIRLCEIPAPPFMIVLSSGVSISRKPPRGEMWV